MKITQVETIPLDYSVVAAGDAYKAYESESSGPAFQAEMRRRLRGQCVVYVHTDEGITGLSRALPGVREHIKALAPVISGQNPLDHERLWQAMYATTRTVGRGDRRVVTALGVIDLALWDLKGKALGQPVWRLLGGYRQRVPAYGDIFIRHRSPQQVVRALASWVEAGFRQIKFHTIPGRNDMADLLADLQAIREAVGPDITLMIDAAMAWEPWYAAELAQRFEEYDIHWLEAPVHWDDEAEGLAVVAAATRIPIASGEGESTLYAARDLITRGGVRVLQPNIMGGGGYTAWLKYAALAQAYHVQVAPHGSTTYEFIAPIVAAVPNGLTVSTCPLGEPYQIWSRLYIEPPDLKDGWITLSNRPGLGLEVDPDFVARYRM